MSMGAAAQATFGGPWHPGRLCGLDALWHDSPSHRSPRVPAARSRLGRVPQISMAVYGELG